MKVMHIGQMIGGLDIYIRNSISYASGKNEYVIVHGKEDGCYPIYCKGREVKMYPTNLQRSISAKADFSAIRQIIKIVRAEKPDIIHCHSAKGGILGRIAGFITSTPTVYTAHAFSFLSSGNKLVRSVYKAVEYITKFNAYLLACSESERRLGCTIVKYSPQKALLWRNAVPMPELKEDEISLSIPSHPYICYIGRPSYQKNPIFLVDMFAKIHQRHPELCFYLLGVGYHSPNLEQMQKCIMRHHLESCCFMMPWVKHNDAMAFVKHSLFYLSVSRYEGLPLSIIEAMALGKCIIASKVVGNTDCVYDNVNGFLIDLKIEKFTDKVDELLQNPSLIETMGKESQRIFENEFRIENRIHLLEDIYEQVSQKR